MEVSTLASSNQLCSCFSQNSTKIELMGEQIRIGSRKVLELRRERDVLDLVFWTLVFLPVLLFVLEGGLVGNSSLADWLSSINRVLALVATSILLIHLLLVARISWVEKILGLDGATSRHKKLGKPIIYLFALHLLISVSHYALVSEQTLIAGLLELNLNYFEIGLATAGFLVMIVVAYTSAVASRKRFSYELWYFIHLASYIAVSLAIPHQFVFGTDFLSQAWMSAFYVALYLYVFGSVGWFRLLAPISQSIGLKITKIEPERNNTTSIHIDGAALRNLPYEAGQFFMVRVLTRNLWLQAHPFSVSSSPNEKTLRFTIGSRGDFTSEIPKLKIGTRVILEGPYGIFSEKTRTKRNMLMIAAGIGVAPVRSLARSVVCEPGDVTILYRVNDSKDAALLKELKEISIAKGHNLIVLDGERFDQSWLPGKSEKPEHARLLEMAPHALESDVYVCGPAAWTSSVERTLRNINVKSDQIHAEEFAW